MKKKFIILTLCFTLIFSSLNYKKSYADGGVISLPMLATVCALGVGAGMALNDLDDLYDIGHIFYNKNKQIWNDVLTTFNACVSFNKTIGKLSVGKDFIDIFKSTFSDYVDTGSGEYTFVSSLSFLNGLDYSSLSNDVSFDISDKVRLIIPKPQIIGTKVYYSINYESLKGLGSGGSFVYIANSRTIPSSPVNLTFRGYDVFIDTLVSGTSISFNLLQTLSAYGVTALDFNSVSLPYVGGYDDTVLGEEDKDISLPSDLGDLVGGKVSSDSILGDSVMNNPYTGTGDINLPFVSNPSIGVDSSVSFPFVGDSPLDPPIDSPLDPPIDSPNEGIWATIKDFIISLVVPSDTFWTDTWGGLYNNFTSSFPMVDMGGFNDLVTGEKKFPNIDVNIMGVKGRVVNGDVINSIVDWLRPIIAGFIMLCLMFFNYRKIYKLIRNNDPFPGIAQGTSDFSTGISEYQDYKQSLREYRDFLYNHRGGN